MALTHLHELKIPHRDLKPANIMVRSLEPRLDLVLADFGLARVLDLSKEMHSRLIISAAYASPQASSSGAISPPMDWWSLGVIVAELAQGRNPFQLENGEWLSDRVIMDWISSRPIDLSGVEDGRIASLCRGLTLRDDRRAQPHGDLSDLISHRYEAGEVITVGPDDSLLTAFKRMRDSDVSQLPVVDKSGRAIGLIDESDLLVKVHREPSRFNDPVSKAMTDQLETLPPDAKITDLLGVFDRGRVAIVMHDNKFLGLITRTDWLSYLRLHMPKSSAPPEREFV